MERPLGQERPVQALRHAALRDRQGAPRGPGLRAGPLRPASALRERNPPRARLPALPRPRARARRRLLRARLPPLHPAGVPGALPHVRPLLPADRQGLPLHRSGGCTRSEGEYDANVACVKGLAPRSITATRCSRARAWRSGPSGSCGRRGPTRASVKSTSRTTSCCTPAGWVTRSASRRGPMTVDGGGHTLRQALLREAAAAPGRHRASCELKNIDAHPRRQRRPGRRGHDPGRDPVDRLQGPARTSSEEPGGGDHVPAPGDDHPLGHHRQPRERRRRRRVRAPRRHPGLRLGGQQQPRRRLRRRARLDRATSSSSARTSTATRPTATAARSTPTRTATSR